MDYLIWPWLEKTDILGPDGLMSSVPRLSAYVDRMKADPAAKECRTKPDVYRKFVDKYLGGNPDFDMEYPY